MHELLMHRLQFTQHCCYLLNPPCWTNALRLWSCNSALGTHPALLVRQQQCLHCSRARQQGNTVLASASAVPENRNLGRISGPALPKPGASELCKLVDTSYSSVAFSSLASVVMEYPHAEKRTMLTGTCEPTSCFEASWLLHVRCSAC